MKVKQRIEEPAKSKDEKIKEMEAVIQAFAQYVEELKRDQRLKTFIYCL